MKTVNFLLGGSGQGMQHMSLEDGKTIRDIVEDKIVTNESYEIKLDGEMIGPDQYDRPIPDGSTVIAFLRPSGASDSLAAELKEGSKKKKAHKPKASKSLTFVKLRDPKEPKAPRKPRKPKAEGEAGAGKKGRDKSRYEFEDKVYDDLGEIVEIVFKRIAPGKKVPKSIADHKYPHHYLLRDKRFINEGYGLGGKIKRVPADEKS